MVGRLLGIDHGDRRIGLALSDPIPIIASPLKTLTVNTHQDAINEIITLIKEHEIVLVVIGLPIGMRGQDTQQTKHVIKFADELIVELSQHWKKSKEEVLKKLENSIK